MNFKTKAVVLSQKKYSENQKYLNILTPKNGVLNVRLRLYGQITKSVFSNISIGGFYEFSLFNGRFHMIVDSVEEIEIFFNLRYNPKNLALAQYLCEISYICNLSLQNTEKQLKLLLNSIWMLETEKSSCSMIKAVFELKLLSLSGYMLNLVCCKFCCNYEKENMFLNVSQGFLVCSDCLNKVNNMKNLKKLTKAVLYAMRFVLYKEDENVFKFKLTEKHQELFSNVMENIILIYLEKEPVTLEIYKQFDEEFKI